MTEYAEITPAAARKLLARIRRSVENLSDLIRSAWEQKAWKAAGYASWDDCCTAEFPELRISGEQRLRVVGELVDSGMSDRAIAVALNISHKTVSKERPSHGSDYPRDSKAVGRDGKRYGRTYVPGGESTQRLRELNQQHGLTEPEIAKATGVSVQTVSKIKTGRQKTVATIDAEAIEAFYADTFGPDHAMSSPGDESVVGGVVSLWKKTGPQMNAARAEARHSLVHAAITLQKAARQISLVNPQYLRFGRDDQELEQAPRIIAESIKSINESMKEIRRDHSAS